MNELEALIIEPEHHQCSVIWLHGLGANGHDFEPLVPELRLDASAGIRFIFPHAPHMPVSINGGMHMPAWYDIRNPDLTQMEDAQNIQQSASMIGKLIEQEIEAGIHSENILLAGFSQGGAIALYTGLSYPQPLAGILALSTYLPLQDSVSEHISSANAKTSIMMMHGLADPVIPVTTAEKSYQLLEQQGCSIEWKTYPMPHSLCPPQVMDISQWLKKVLTG